MKKIADYLTDYIRQRGIITDADYPIYIYGFQSGMEISICLGICFLIAGILDSFYEGIILVIVFFCIRSYAGGVHLKKYTHCLLCSCTVYSSLLMLNRLVTLNSNMSLFLSGVCSLVIIICSVTQKNGYNSKEQCYYIKKLFARLVLIGFISLVFFLCRFSIMLSMISYSLSAISVSAILQYNKEIYNKL